MAATSVGRAAGRPCGSATACTLRRSAQAWDDLYYLDRAAQVQLKAMASGRAPKPVAPDVAAAHLRANAHRRRTKRTRASGQPAADIARAKPALGAIVARRLLARSDRRTPDIRPPHAHPPVPSHPQPVRLHGTDWRSGQPAAGHRSADTWPASRRWAVCQHPPHVSRRLRQPHGPRQHALRCADRGVQYSG